MTDHTGASSIHRHIRLFRDSDEAAVVGVWHRAGLAAYTYLPTFQTLTIDTAHEVFRDVIRARCEIWVGALVHQPAGSHTMDERIVAYLAMDGSYIDRLYVDPSEWRQGWGTRFIILAKQLSPLGLELHTHQANDVARVFYERHGFEAVKFGISPPPESAPDVEYHWRPKGFE